MPDTALRVALAVVVAIAALHYAAMLAPIARGKWWPLQLMIASGLGGILYVFAGQFKAMFYDVPFDWLSWLGLFFFVTFNVGAVIVLRDRHRCKGK